jgi:acyl-CoA dehydrogenase
MNFEYSENVRALQELVRNFMERHVVPANRAYLREAEHGVYPLSVVEPLKVQARGQKLWNLFLPSLRESEPEHA